MSRGQFSLKEGQWKLTVIDRAVIDRAVDTP